VTALLFAEARWGNGEGIYDYGAEARYMLDVFRNREVHNGGVVDGVISIFGSDPLPLREPREEFASQTAPGSLMPGYFDYWGERTGESYWHDAAERSREMLRLVANPDNGLTPGVVNFDGTFVEGEEIFAEPSYNVAFNIAVDTAWYGTDPEQIEIANHLVRFFNAFGGSYPALFTYDGEPTNGNPSGALVALNGVAAGIATVPARDGFIRKVSDTPIQTGAFRYFDGINQILSLMYLTGYVRPYY
jgi:endo-1,4-beta-D-glucanase Y